MDIVETWREMFSGGLDLFLILSILALGIAHSQAYRTRWAIVPCVLLSIVCGGIVWIGMDRIGVLEVSIAAGIPVVLGLCLAVGASAPAWIFGKRKRAGH